MRNATILIAVGLSLAMAKLNADTLTIPGHMEADQVQILPKRGISMDAVLKNFGEPDQRYGPIGEPPISEWVYGGFRVYFEHQTVLHTINLHTLIYPK